MKTELVWRKVLTLKIAISVKLVCILEINHNNAIAEVNSIINNFKKMKLDTNRKNYDCQNVAFSFWNIYPKMLFYVLAQLWIRFYGRKTPLQVKYGNIQPFRSAPDPELYKHVLKNWENKGPTKAAHTLAQSHLCTALLTFENRET